MSEDPHVRLAILDDGTSGPTGNLSDLNYIRETVKKFVDNFCILQII